MTPEVKEVLKKKGLNTAEKFIILALDESIAIGDILVKETSTPIDDTVMSAVKMFRDQIKELVDKIDGEDNQ